MATRYLASVLLLMSVTALGCGDDDDDGIIIDAGAGTGGAGTGGAGTGGAGGDGEDAGVEDDAGAENDAGDGMDGLNDVRMVEVIATEYQFTPETIEASPGEMLIVLLRNEGTMAHSIAFELPGGDVALDELVQPGETAQLTIEVPDMEGDYVYYCPVDGHRALGMVGTLSVE